MCESTSVFRFRGVVVSTATLVLLVSAIGAIGVSGPHCVYLAPSQELDCVCGPEDEGYDVHSSEEAPLLFPNEEVVNMAGNASVASVKIHSCHTLRLHLDFRSLPRPFYRLRIEDVNIVFVEGIIVLDKDMIDVWFRGINDTLDFTGGLTCANCAPYVKKVVNETAVTVTPTPEIKLHIIEVGDVKFRGFVSEAGLRIKVRDAEEVLIQDSYFTAVAKDGLEIYNTDRVVVHHSEFMDTLPGSVLLNKVQNMSVTESILARESIEVLDGPADIGWRCTAAPESIGDPGLMDSEEWQGCTNDLISRPLSGVEANGAIVLASISAVILAVAIVIIGFLHKSGRLDAHV